MKKIYKEQFYDNLTVFIKINKYFYNVETKKQDSEIYFDFEEETYQEKFLVESYGAKA